MSKTVTTQAELDAAIAAFEPTIYIESPEGVWLTLVGEGSSHVVARGSSHVVAWGSSHVVAWGSSHVDARDSSHVDARPYVAVHLHSQRVTLTGGVVIDMTAIDQTDPTVWCDMHGVTVAGGLATLYKAVDDNLQAGHSYTVTTYEIGVEVAAGDWLDNHDCGGGLHLGPSVSCATAYMDNAARWLAVEVAVGDIRPILGNVAKCKVRSCRVVGEVDRWGNAVPRVEASA